MREFIDKCSSCGKPVYCENGFFNGEQLISGKLLCEECAQEYGSENEKDNLLI